MDDRPKSVRHAQPEPLIRMFALLKRGRVRIPIGWSGSDVVRTHPFEVTVDYAVGVKNLEPVTDVKELGNRCKNSYKTAEKDMMRHTSCSRSTSGCSLT